MIQLSNVNSEYCYNADRYKNAYHTFDVVECEDIAYTAESKNCEYSELLINCEYCFGRISLHHKKYHILNQQYERAAYFARVAEIKKELLYQNLYGVLTTPPAYALEYTVRNRKVM